ncbi:hypothetical protein K438DRAFT_1762947 [Mycena galopus ATCC 62051]|nr:hypothetical protein K438DRAFT_1762947 [Mycena galopus ATCC 62051]
MTWQMVFALSMGCDADSGLSNTDSNGLPDIYQPDTKEASSFPARLPQSMMHCSTLGEHSKGESSPKGKPHTARVPMGLKQTCALATPREARKAIATNTTLVRMVNVLRKALRPKQLRIHGSRALRALLNENKGDLKLKQEASQALPGVI